MASLYSHYGKGSQRLQIMHSKRVLAWVQSLSDTNFFPITLFLSSPTFFFFGLPLILPPLFPCLPSFFLSYSFSFFSSSHFLFFFPSCFSFSLSSLHFILLLPPFPLLYLSHCFGVFSFSPLNFFLVSPLYQGGCYEHKG